MTLHDLDREYVTEDESYECKARLNIEKPLSWLKSVCAFANAKGGTLYVGVEDKSNKLIGFEQEELDREKMNFYRVLRDHFPSSLHVVSRSIPYERNGKVRYVLRFDVLESETKPVILKYDGMPLIYVRRDGFTNIPTYEEIQRLSLSSANRHYDTQRSDVKFAPEDFTTFYRFFFERKGRYPTEKELASLGFFDDEKNLFFGSLLFRDHCQQRNTKIVCTCYPERNKGTSTILDTREFNGNLIEGYAFIRGFVDQYEKHGFVKTEEGRVDTRSFPPRAVFEAIINALSHRDYFIDDSQISVDLFPNRLVLSSPGSFFGESDLKPTVHLSDFVSKRRNSLVCSIFVALNAMETRGTGFEKITEDYAAADQHHKPYIFAKNLQFSIVLPDLLDKEGVAIAGERIRLLDPQELEERDYSVLSYCYNAERSVKEIVDHLGISNSSYFRSNVLYKLVEKKLLKKRVDGKTSYYTTDSERVRLN